MGLVKLRGLAPLFLPLRLNLRNRLFFSLPARSHSDSVGFVHIAASGRGFASLS